MPSLTPLYSGKFKHDLKIMAKRGYDLERLKTLMRLLVNGLPLPQIYLDHPLKGDWKGARDAHIAPDWILIYRLIEPDIIKFERTGTHADLLE
ncbi:mRNA interferase YafQ [Deltaproteobacteria bacterium]|nr:mRNA interferase YafQ [Deltaproteobacteria bacterium]